jgi:lysozyme
MTQTQAQCEAWLAKQVAEDYAAVQRCIKPQLTLGQAVAFTDAVHNEGAAVVCGSRLQALANAGELDRACLQLVDAKGRDGLPTGWTKAGGRVVDGLIARREAEVIVCIRGLE